MDELGRHKMFDDGFSTQLARGDNKFKHAGLAPEHRPPFFWLVSQPASGR